MTGKRDQLPPQTKNLLNQMKSDPARRKAHMTYVFAPPSIVSISIVNKEERVAVRRIYWLVRNYAEHAKEMGSTGLEPPLTFLKPADAQALVVAESGQTEKVCYPSLTSDFQHEIELVMVVWLAGKNISLANAYQHVYGHAVGLDMTRRDSRLNMAKQGRPWCIGKAFNHSAVIGSITPINQAGVIENAEIHSQVNGVDRQRSKISELIWSVAKTIEQLSTAWESQPGDLIYTGTPQGVGAVHLDDLLVGSISGLSSINVRIAPPSPLNT
jgi:fumarylpyruvate hydrolase